MKYIELKKIHNIDLLLLLYLEIVTVGNEIYKINHFPDFEKTPYRSGDLSNYSFDDYWDFSHKFNSVLQVDVGEVYAFHFDDICRISESHNITYEQYDPIYILEKARIKNDKLFFEEGMAPEFDGFTFHDLTVNFTDNLNKKIMFQGGIQAASDTISDCDWDLYTELTIIGINKDIDTRPIFQQLLAEGCNLYSKKSFKLAFFIIYSALESYVNLKTNGEDEEIRIKEKLNIAFKANFPNLLKHNIYNSLIGDLASFSSKRHAIAHGRSNIDITIDDCLSIMIFTCIVVISLEDQIDTLEKIKTYVLEIA